MLESQGTSDYFAKEGLDKTNSSSIFTYWSELKYLQSKENINDWKTRTEISNVIPWLLLYF